MSIDNPYGVLQAKARQGKKGGGKSPHYQIWVVDQSGTNYRIAVNAKSQNQPANLQYYINTNFQNPITDRLTQKLSSGFTPLSNQSGGLALDYIRGGLFSLAQVDHLFAIASTNLLENLLDEQIQHALADPKALIYAFGVRWPETNTRDNPFDFIPDNGVHDIHMNQGDTDEGQSNRAERNFNAENGIWQDGALFIHLPARSAWTAIFLKFQSQSWKTDDSGNPL